MDQIKPYRIVASVKNNRLWQAIMRRFPDCKTQADAARRLGIHAVDLCAWLSMRHWPGGKLKKLKVQPDFKINWSKKAISVCDILGVEPIEIFDPKFYGRVLPVPTKLQLEVGIRHLGANARLLNSPKTPEDILSAKELNRLLEKTLATLKPKEEIAVRNRFGMNEDGEIKTFEQIGQQINVTRERARQLSEGGMKKLQHDSRISILKDTPVKSKWE